MNRGAGKKRYLCSWGVGHWGHLGIFIEKRWSGTSGIFWDNWEGAMPPFKAPRSLESLSCDLVLGLLYHLTIRYDTKCKILFKTRESLLRRNNFVDFFYFVIYQKGRWKIPFSKILHQTLKFMESLSNILLQRRLQFIFPTKEQSPFYDTQSNTSNWSLPWKILNLCQIRSWMQKSSTIDSIL